MQAIILAAGIGKRLGEFTSRNTKCMLKVNERRLIDRMLEQLSVYDLTRIVIVTGYEGKNLRDHVTLHHPELPIVFVDNPIFDKTNNIYSLWLARKELAEDDTILLESDLIFHDSVLRVLYEPPYHDCALVYNKYEKEYVVSCEKLRDERRIFAEELKSISWLKVYDSESNFILCEVNDSKMGRNITERLLADFNILVDNIQLSDSYDSRTFIIIGIKKRQENSRLDDALRSL